MEVDEHLIGMLSDFTAGELLATKEVGKVISYYYFDEYRRCGIRSVKVKLDAMCDFISHIELVLKKAEKEMNNDYSEV